MNDIMNLFSLNGKNAVVTGANTGLGQGICVALAAAGAHVFGVARRSCDETAAKIAAEGGQFAEVRADLSDFAAIDSILEQVHAHADRIDILVNNAGIIKRCDAIDVTPENWDALNERVSFLMKREIPFVLGGDFNVIFPSACVMAPLRQALTQTPHWMQSSSRHFT